MRDESVDSMTKAMLKVSQEMRNSFMNFHTEINKFISSYGISLANSEDTVNYGGTV